MFAETGDFFQACEKLLARAMSDLTMELRLVEPDDLVANVHFERAGHLRDIVESAAELFFKPGTVQICGTGTVCLDWEKPVTIGLQMEFNNRDVRAFFHLWLAASEAAVQLDYLDTKQAGAPTAETVRRLSEAIDDARLRLPLTAVAAYHRALLGQRPDHPV